MSFGINKLLNNLLMQFTLQIQITALYQPKYCNLFASGVNAIELTIP